MGKDDPSNSAAQIVQAILDNTMAVIYAKDRDGRYQLVNRRFEELFDVTLEEIRGRTDFDIFPREMAEKFHRNDVTVALKNEPTEFEEIAPHTDGPHTYISLKFPYRDEKGACIGTCGVSTDITPRKTVEAALEESEERFRQLAENVPNCFWISEVETWRVLYVNPAYERIWGRSREELYKNPEAWIHAIHPADRKRVAEAFFANVTEGGFREEYRIVQPDGSMRWIADHGFPIQNERGEVYRVAGIAEDITQRHELEQQVTKISSHERQRISRELHDSLGQQLTGLGFLAKSLCNRLEATAPNDAGKAKEILHGIKDALAELRLVVRGLAPVDFDEYGLESALRELATSISQYSGVPCDFVCPQSFAICNNTIATQMYRIAQEAANNAVKHAQARRITLMLEYVDGALRLEVRDDGEGGSTFDNSNGMGLRIMRYRSNIIGADLSVTSTDAGTTVACTLSEEAQRG